MNKFVAIASLALVANCATAQLSFLPPASSTDGIPIRAKGINGGETHWDSPTGLGAYRFTSDAPGSPNMGSPDNILGLSWVSTTPASFTSARLGSNPRTFRAIFVGASAAWQNDFGYTYTGELQGQDSFTIFTNISTSASGNTVNFGDYVDVPLLPGENQTFDFWFNGVGGLGQTNPATPTETGGIYTIIHPGASTPYLPPGNVVWAQTPIMVNTWIPALGSFQDVATYLVGLEDWRLDLGSDNDRNDFLFAIQIFEARGNPLDFGPSLSTFSGASLVPSAVPEPGTTSVIGAIALSGLAAVRRIRKAILRRPR